MYLQLSENVRVKSYNRRAHKVRAHKVKSHLRTLSESEPENPYIFIPDKTGVTKGIWIREDQFDWMSPGEWRIFVKELAPFQPAVENGTLSEGMFLNDRASRRAKREAKKEEKQLRKTANKERRSATLNNLFGTLGGVAKNIFGTPETPPDLSPEQTLPEEAVTPFYKNPIVLGLGALAVGGTIYYFATRE
jgi:hypothetical protein